MSQNAQHTQQWQQQGQSSQSHEIETGNIMQFGANNTWNPVNVMPPTMTTSPNFQDQFYVPEASSSQPTENVSLDMGNIGDNSSGYMVNASTAPYVTASSPPTGDMTMADSPYKRRPQNGSQEDFVMSGNVSQMVWAAGKQQAKQAISLYANIDILRPFFDVTPKEVRDRLLQSLVPVVGRSQQAGVAEELYGPLMVVLTLVATLLFEMKHAEHVVEDGTLMGTALAVCFGYWAGSTALVYCTAYVCNSQIRPLQVACLLGYGLSAHCVVVLLGTLIHAASHTMFYLLWAGLGGAAAARMVSVVLTLTSGHSSQRATVATVTGALPMLFLLYLHFAYHRTVQVILEA